jgi:hypothetical protein
MLLKLEVPEYFLMLHTISSKVMPAGVGNGVLGGFTGLVCRFLVFLDVHQESG